ncbi:lon protease homolog 4, chloroplastic/mitochondrial-like [Raphanus sativus]|uniref:Lon protease homolog 4, chloroplastic/mitochondrial-like n=1 Tax=Raphanus sativus TaxID=3726 RepID=A0A6J0P2I0_RAPSA|nr:lon protease homolog 4, chloroplastic/mitochondrial-like [Raphanus sativus]
MLKLFTSHHVASRFKNRSSHKLAPRAFLSTLTDSKPTDTVSAKQCLDDCQTVVALPLLRKPLIPGFYMPLYVKDPKVLAALQESKSGQAPYAGAFLLKDDKDASTASSSSSFETVNILDKLKGKELLKKIYQVGTLAQILSIQGEQVILVGRKRLQITEMVNEDPLTVKTHHINDKTYDKNDKVIIKATYFEVISTLREVLETTSLWRDQVQT